MIKKCLIAVLLLTGLQSFSQTTSEKEVLQLSADIFKWEVENNFTALDTIFHEQFVVFSSNGMNQFKKDYIKRLQSGAFIHNSINVEENKATVTENTAVVIGKGRFAVTVSGNKADLHLDYIEVFTRKDGASPWKALAIKATILDK
ncbi:MAG: hypothetical protein RL542_679 [Bacteroidota bacterium]|jgi:hypothetical protein